MLVLSFKASFNSSNSSCNLSIHLLSPTYNKLEVYDLSSALFFLSLIIFTKFSKLFDIVKF